MSVVFFVTNKPKDGKVRQRLVIDARRSNRLFRKPPWCPLSSGEGLARMEVNGVCFTAQEDVKDFFNRLGISAELSRYFGFPKVSVRSFTSSPGK